MADREFDVAMAKAWETEVNNELQAVSGLLVRVGTVCQSDPVEDDRILKEIYETGEKIINATGELKRQFDETIEAMNKIINEVEKSIREGLEKLGEFASTFHLGH